MPTITLADVTLHYREAGAGPLLLVLPGNTASSACHDGELAHFADRFHVVSPDFRGTGRSTRLAAWPDDWYPQCAHDMAALLDHLGAERCIAMGTSGGAIVALWLAILHPARVTAVIADSTASGYPPDWLRAAMATRSERSSGQVAFWQGAHGDDWAQVVDEDTAMLLRIADRGGDFFGGRLGGDCLPGAAHRQHWPTACSTTSARPSLPWPPPSPTAASSSPRVATTRSCGATPLSSGAWRTRFSHSGL